MSFQRYADMIPALEAAGEEPGEYAGVLEQCREFFSRYAALEQGILGEVPVQFPAHLLESLEDQDPLVAGETMAQRELDRQPEVDVALDGMQVFLDREQFKVYRFDPQGNPRLLGFFLFDPDWGPAFAVSRDLPRGEADRVLARLYGHFLMDNDPYTIQLVWSEEQNPDDSAVRATAFASVFLIPEPKLKEYLRAVSTEPLDVTPDLVRQLAVYFGVAPSLVVLRFVSLGWIGPGAMPPLLAALQGQSASWEPAEEAVYGDRYARLALEAEARELIDLDTLARYLETTPGEAALWKERFRL